jgi:hypothetical protein
VQPPQRRAGALTGRRARRRLPPGRTSPTGACTTT